MPRDMFGDVANPSITVGTKKWYTVPLSIVTHVAVLGVLVVVPLLATNALPTPQSVLAFVVAPPPPPPAPAPPPTTVQSRPMPNPALAPLEAPREITPEPPRNRSLAALVEGAPDSIPGGIPGIAVAVAPPPPSPPRAPVPVGGDVKEPRKIFDVPPVYPPIAQAAKVQGLVVIEATIARDGSVKNAHVLRHVALLDEAALDAVRQWRFTPTLLNGVPIEVIMTVTVNFRLRLPSRQPPPAGAGVN
jgi:periplasmic protein TonB